MFSTINKTELDFYTYVNKIVKILFSIKTKKKNHFFYVNKIVSKYLNLYKSFLK